MWGHDLGNRLSAVSRVRGVQAYLGMQAREMGAGCESLSPVCMWRGSVYLGLHGTKPIKREAFHIPKALGLHPAQNCRGDSRGSVECTEFMGLCGEEMASKEPIRNKRYWNHYKEKQSYRNRIVWDFLTELFLPWERRGERYQTCAFNTYLEYEFHDRKLLWNRLESNFHIGLFPSK